MKSITACCLLLFAVSCTGPRHITTTWKATQATETYEHVLVVAILPDEDTVLRKKIEQGFTSELNGLGYQAESALTKFGADGLRQLGEESTYLELHNTGIEAVLIIALAGKTNQSYHRAGKAYVHPNSYYYRRIWDYKKNLVDTTAARQEAPYFWEGILFNLSTLEAIATIRTQPFTQSQQAPVNDELAKLFLKKLLHEKVITKKAVSPKAF